MAKPDLGSKRQCESCGAKFFDLNRDPITCPKCGTIFQVAATSTRAARAAPEDDEPETDAAVPDVVSLEEAEDGDAKAATAVVADDDIDIGDDDTADDDTFLEEEEEESDDVTGLIDGDIETDDEN